MYGFNSRLEWREEGLSVLANRKIEITQIEQQRGDSLGWGEEHHLKDLWDQVSCGGQWLRVCLPIQGTWVQTLVEELGSHCCGAAEPTAATEPTSPGACVPQLERGMCTTMKDPATKTWSNEKEKAPVGRPQKCLCTHITQVFEEDRRHGSKSTWKKMKMWWKIWTYRFQNLNELSDRINTNPHEDTSWSNCWKLRTKKKKILKVRGEHLIYKRKIWMLIWMTVDFSSEMWRPEGKGAFLKCCEERTVSPKFRIQGKYQERKGSAQFSCSMKE